MKKMCFLLIALIIFSTGCYTLRKKFVRKKDNAKEAAVYLDLKNYSGAAVSVEDYQDNVSYLNGWLDEASLNLTENGNRKRVRHSLAEAVESMENIIDSYNDDGKRFVKHLYEYLKDIRDDFAKKSTSTVVDCNVFKSRIETFKRDFTHNFNYREAKQWLK
jgi:L-lactate utilization protein LutB